jgi:hypothetical protein
MDSFDELYGSMASRMEGVYWGVQIHVVFVVCGLVFVKLSVLASRMASQIGGIVQYPDRRPKLGVQN